MNPLRTYCYQGRREDLRDIFQEMYGRQLEAIKRDFIKRMRASGNTEDVTIEIWLDGRVSTKNDVQIT